MRSTIVEPPGEVWSKKARAPSGARSRRPAAERAGRPAGARARGRALGVEQAQRGLAQVVAGRLAGQ